MTPLAIRGHMLGEGRPLAIVSLMDGTGDALAKSAQRAAEAGAEVLEWRADFFEDIGDAMTLGDVARAIRAVAPSEPVIFTFRSTAQGGNRDLPLEDYVALVQAAIECGSLDLVDIELGVGEKNVRGLVSLAHEHGVGAIVSHHDFAGTPSPQTMCDLLHHMASLGADIPKLAVMARDSIDCLSLMEATARARKLVDTPLLTMSMGEAGTISRLTGEAYGSCLTFCAMDRPSAPGQVALAQALPALSHLHEALSSRPSSSAEGNDA